MGEKKKIILDRDHYVNVVDVLSWMYDENKSQKIRFDMEKCFKYKLNNQLHRVDGPAIDYYSGRNGEYYLFGKPVTEEFHINNKRHETLESIFPDFIP